MRTLWYVLFVMPSMVCGTRAVYLNITQREGIYSQVMNFTFDRNSEEILIFPTSSSKYPYEVHAWSTTASEDFPILLVVRQEKQVLSWQIPFNVLTSKRNEYLYFQNTSRILCHNNMHQIIKMMTGYSLFLPLAQHFIISLSTSSPSNVDISITVEEKRDFYIENGESYSILVSPSQTQYYYYSFNDDTSNVVLEVTSDDDVCLVVSIQDSYCPVFDLDSDVTYQGQFQTINRKGGMSIRWNDYPDGFFLVFVARADNYDCIEQHILTVHRSANVVNDNRSSIVNFSITKGINSGDYEMAVGITFASIAGFYLIAVGLAFAFYKWGTTSKFTRSDQLDHTNTDSNEPSVVVTSLEIKRQLLLKNQLTLDLLAKNTAKNRSNTNYVWHVSNILIFYGIPVVQLVATYQLVSKSTGDGDMCYYNFLCAKPLWIFSDFNHIFSNVGYAFMGILFMLMVFCRHKTIKNNNTGIPINNGIFYAMGIALIMEGVLSACYHVCPSRSNFQFDTSFMYVMAVLCMLKVYQNRHPDIVASAYETFTVLGLVIILALIGILNGILGVQIVLVMVYLLLCVYISLKVYFVGFISDGLKQLKDSIKHSEDKIKALLLPTKKTRFFILLVGFIINCAVAVVGLYLYKADVIDFASFLLMLLLMNTFIYVSFYTIMKLVHHEKICFEAVIYGVCALVAWIGGTIFFLNYATQWFVSPAESRKLNQKCILMSFYDVHDIWHLLSAAALYLTFMYLMCLDDDLLGKKRSDIIVF